MVSVSVNDRQAPVAPGKIPAAIFRAECFVEEPMMRTRVGNSSWPGGRQFFSAGLLASLLTCSVLAEDQRDDNPVIFESDFESIEWWQEWGLKASPERVDTVSRDVRRGFEPHAGRALRIRVDRGGHYGVSLQYRFEERTGTEPEEVWLRYYLRFGSDWTPARGGKLPGIAGTYGRAGWGGRKVNGIDGWSARGLFRGQKDGRTPVGFYCYHADMRGRYGDNWIWDKEGFPGLENNRWYCVEQYVKLNQPGQNDGILRAWVDGSPVFEKTDVRMRDIDTLKIETVWMNVYHGGTWTAETDHHLYIDDVMISSQRMPR